MGVYDFVGNIQIKCTPEPSFKNYKLDDNIELLDGIYIGYEGWFRVRNSKIVDIGKHVYDKWGNLLLLENVLNTNSPIMEALKGKEEK